MTHLHTILYKFARVAIGPLMVTLLIGVMLGGALVPGSVSAQVLSKGAASTADQTVSGADLTCQEPICPLDSPLAFKAEPIPLVSHGVGINEKREVVGNSFTYRGYISAFMLKGASKFNLDIPGTNATYGRGINNSGLIVGDRSEGTYTHAYVWENGVVTDIFPDQTPQQFSRTFGVNNNGVVLASIGWGDLVLYDNRTRVSTPVILNPPGGVAYGMGINDRGAIIGGTLVPCGYTTCGRGFVHTTSTTTIEPFPGDTESMAFGINNNGEVVGFSSNLPAQRSFIWANGTIAPLGTLGGTKTIAFDINNRSEIVGTSMNSANDFRAVIFRNRQPIDLNTVTTGPGNMPVLHRADSINDRGDIVANTSTNPNLPSQSFVLRRVCR